MTEILKDIRYTAAIAKCKGTYAHISDIADDFPIRSTVNYWKEAKYPRSFQPVARTGDRPVAGGSPEHLQPDRDTTKNGVYSGR